MVLRRVASSRGTRGSLFNTARARISSGCALPRLLIQKRCGRQPVQPQMLAVHPQHVFVLQSGVVTALVFGGGAGQVGKHGDSDRW